MQNVIKHSAVCRFISVIAAWFGRQWGKSSIVKRMTTAGSGEQISDGSFFTRLWLRIHRSYASTFDRLRLTKLLDGSIFFMCYLICMALQMGATIDYGILLTTHYRAQRAKLAPWDAVGEALTLSLPTLLTSGLALVIAGYAVGLISSLFYISSIGIMLGRGAVASLILIVLLLPCLLVWTDRWMKHGSKDSRG